MNALVIFVWQSNQAGDEILAVMLFGKSEDPVQKKWQSNAL